MDFWGKILCGMAVGVGAVVPGVSGGVLAAVLGVYEPIMAALSGFFKDVKKNTLFLLPYIIGGGVGFLVFSGIIGLFMEHAERQMLFLFAGLVIGGFPSLAAEANRDGFKLRYMFAAAGAFFLMTAASPLFSFYIANPFLRYFAAGAAYSFGSVIPGISASFILINMGVYRELLVSIASPAVFIPFGAGFFAVTVMLIKAVDFLFRRYHAAAYYTVIGLLASSIVTAMPCISNPVADTAILVSGVVLGFLALSR